MKDGSLWPKDFLATDLEDSRIMSFGYDFNIVHSDTAEVTQGSLESDARSLCALLSAERNTPDSVSPHSNARISQISRRFGHISREVDLSSLWHTVSAV
jgi:hypothetical protein